MRNLEWHTEDIYTDYLLGIENGEIYVFGDVTQIESKIREDDNGIRTQYEYEVETESGEKVRQTIGVCCSFYKKPILWKDFKVEDNETNVKDLGCFTNRSFAKKLIEDNIIN